MSEIICLMAALKCLQVCDVSGELVKRNNSSNLWKYKKCIVWDESGPEFLLVLYIMQFDGFLIPLGKIFGRGQSMQ